MSGTPGASPARRLLSALGAILTAVLVVAATLVLVVAVASWFSPHDTYRVFGHPTLVVVSGSMAPAIHSGDLIVDDAVAPARAAHLTSGQIITFRRHSGLVVTHRVIAVVRDHHGGRAYRTQGDANNAPDLGLVKPQQVIGVYQARVPAGGYVLEALHRPLVLIPLLAAPLLWLLATVLRRAAHSRSAHAAAITDLANPQPLQGEDT